MSSLYQLQRAVQKSILAQDARPAAAFIAETPGATVRDRLNVYIHGYGARLTEVLRNDFSGLFVLVGESRFTELAKAYIETYPSHEFTVRWYGAAFAHFLSATRPWSDTPAIGEMARLEWAIGLCFDAPDETSVEQHELETLAPEQWPGLRFKLRRCVQRLRFEWNVGQARQAVDRGDPVPGLERLSVAQAWMVSRVGTQIFHRAVAADEAVLLDMIEAGGSFADLCEQLCQWHEADAVAARAVMLLKGWIDSGWLARLWA